MSSGKNIITISREFGSGGRLIGRRLAEKLGVPYYDKELLDRMIRYALKRARDEAEIVYSFDTNVLDNCSFGGAKGGKLGK